MHWRYVFIALTHNMFKYDKSLSEFVQIYDNVPVPFVDTQMHHIQNNMESRSGRF